MNVDQPTMQGQDELAALFSKNLTLEQPPPPQEEPKIVYVSQHYNHSAHAVQQQAHEPLACSGPASEQPQQARAAAEPVLWGHGIDPSCLSSAQLQLFESSQEIQRQRLVALWCLAPPTNSSDNPTLGWCFTTLEQEEALAKARWEQRRAGEAAMGMDGAPLTPTQDSDGRWILTELHNYMEPYMVSGYEDLARREYEESVRAVYGDGLDSPKGSYIHFGTAAGGPSYSRATDPVWKPTNEPIGWSLQTPLGDQHGRALIQAGDEEML